VIRPGEAHRLAGAGSQRTDWHGEATPDDGLVLLDHISHPFLATGGGGPLPSEAPTKKTSTTGPT